MKSHSSLTRIVLCADDFGFTPAVSEGILDLVEAGRLSAVSCMAASPHFLEFAKKLKAHAGHIDIGLHLVLTDLTPLGPISDLTMDECLPSIGTLTKRALFRQLSKPDITAELNRQLDAFINAFDCEPDFIDGHHHVHQLPVIRDLVLDVIAHRFKASPPWLRVCDEKLTTILRRRVSICRGIAIDWFGAYLRQRAKQRGIQVNSGFSGIYDFSGHTPYDQLFDRFTLCVQSGTLIMCHPGRVDETLRNLDSLVDQRENELAYFLSDTFPAMLRRKSLRLGRLEKPPKIVA